MKKRTKGIIVSAFFGFILLTSTVMFALPPPQVEDPDQKLTITGTPMDNYPDVQRAQFCQSSDEAKSTQFVKEYKIPTPCTQPLAIVTDPSGGVWFTQTNTGLIAKFDPNTETFTEFPNAKWPEMGRSMMWGIDYSPDGNLWYTDEAYDSIWTFSIQDQTYQRTSYPKEMDSLPQRLKVVGSKIIVNDFTGNKLTLLDPAQSAEGLAYLTIPSPVDGSVTGGFGIDSQDNVWYTNWVFQQGGVLVNLDKEKLIAQTDEFTGNTTALFDFISIYQFPPGLTTPNGISGDKEGKIWIADTSSNYFFSFNPESETFTKYVTSPPPLSSYGNSSGLIKSPVSRPYWTEIDANGRLVFNEQTGNRIGIFDPKQEKLVEYVIPSKNPNWSDCESLNDCGLAQVFGFTIQDEKIWFTEWVENNIGVVDTSIPLPFDVKVNPEKVSIKRGEQAKISLEIESTNNQNLNNILFNTLNTSLFSDLKITKDGPRNFTLEPSERKIFEVTISASNNALPDLHKVLLGASTEEIGISKYVTVIIE